MTACVPLLPLRSLLRSRVLAACGVLAAGWAVALSAAEPAKYLGPRALVASKDAKTLYVASSDAKQVALVDPHSRKVTAAIDVPAEPTGLALSRDGTRLYVTCAAPQSMVAVLDTASRTIVAKIAAGHTAMGPALAPDGKRLYLCNRFNNDVSVVDVQAGKEIARVPTVREPVAAAVTPDGKSVVVINHLALDRADGFYVSPVVTIIDTRSHQTARIHIADGATGLRGVCLSPDGRHAYVTHVLSNYKLVPSHVDQGWMNMNALSVIDVPKRRLLNTVVLDDLDLGAANPWGVACMADGKWLCVTHAGTDELSIIDAPGLLGRLYEMYPSVMTGGTPSNPGPLPGLRQRIRLPGKGPRGLAIVGSKVYVAQYFSDSLAVVDLEAFAGTPGATGGLSTRATASTGGQAASATPLSRVTTIALGPPPRLSTRRRGEMLFNDATLCYQQWQSCASCHPDGRADGLNWDLLNDGVANPKNTKGLLLAHQTPPAMSAGVRESAEAAVRSGIKNILFSERPEAEAAAIDEYLKSLGPVPSPHLVRGQLSPAARRGKTLFESAEVGCAKCHPPPLYTDLLMHDPGVPDGYNVHEKIDTPTLIEVWRTAPYMHDGHYTTIKELLVQGKHGASHGGIEKLDPRQIDDLIALVLSL